MFESQSQTALGGPKVVLVCSQLYMKERDHRPARIALFPHRFIFHKYNPLALRYRLSILLFCTCRICVRFEPPC